MINILSVELYSSSSNSFKELLLSHINGSIPQNRCISATGAHGIIMANKNRYFRDVLSRFYLNLPDGMPAVFLGRLKGAKEMQRCYGPDVFKLVMESTADLPIYHYFCGGKPEVAIQLKKVCQEKYNNNNVVGTYSPPFREMTDNELKSLAKEINNSGAHILWIGLSTPKQEIFAFRLSKYTNVHFICTVGAAFDFHTGRVRQAPKIIQNLALEWLFRLIIEPKRLWKRYFEIVPLFIYYNLKELGIFIFNKMFGRKKIYAE